MAYRNGPKIVTDGLVLCLDAAGTKSYPGSGNTCYDVSGGNNHGTMVNVGHTSNNYGSFFYNATTDIITVPMTNLRLDYITQEVFFKPSENRTMVFIGSQRGSTSGNSYALWYSLGSGLRLGHYTSSWDTRSYSYTLQVGVWHHFVSTYDGSYEKGYLNGSEIMSYSKTGTISYDINNTKLAVGNDWNSGYDSGATVAVFGDLPLVRIYNRGLSSEEVLQNYNSTKGRFGL